MVSRAVFLERWACLRNPKTSAEERAGNYIILTSHLKNPSVGQDFYQVLADHWRELTEQILRDITCKSCDHAALQVLGYCLYLPLFCDQFSPDMIGTVVTGICEVIQSPEITKSVCTRALWTLANQKLVLGNHVTSIVAVVSELVMSPRLATPTVDAEALNVLIRLAEQYPAEFLSCAEVWYQAIFTLTLYGVPKLQSKALTFAVSMERHLGNSLPIFSLLVKELKKTAISKMLYQLSQRGQDNCHVLAVWNHVINVLGTFLHKQGSFLNELLRVVESGFKHRSVQVQVAAYDSWRCLISNYAQNLDVLTSQKRLKLLLMPLVASAAKDKHEQVEKARTETYWHLIGCLGSHKECLFHEVCVPFLLFCFGLDPKTDTRNLLSRFYSLSTPATPGESPSTSTTSVDVMETPKGNPHTFGNLAVTPTPLRNAESANTPEVPAKEAGPRESAVSVVTADGTHYKIGSLLDFVRSNRSRGNRKEHYVGDSSVAMVMTGCHAFLQFIGFRMDISESLIESDPDHYTVYREFLVPLDVAEFFLLFLDCLLSRTQILTPERSSTLETVVHRLYSLLVCSIGADQVSQGSHASSVIAMRMYNILVRLVDSGRLDNVLCKQTRLDVLEQLSSVPPQLSVGGGSWRVLLHLLLKQGKTEPLNDWFSSTFHKLLNSITTQLVNSEPLREISYLLNRLDGCARDSEVTEDHLSLMWLLTTRACHHYIATTSQINMGTALDPDFSLVGLILKFPFLYLIPHGTKEAISEQQDQWKSTFDLCSRHTNLTVKDPNHCIQLVAKELYSVYGTWVQDKRNTELKSGGLRFDRYQHALTSVLRHLFDKISFNHLHSSKGQGSNCFKTILSLLSRQLVTLTDTVKHPYTLGQMTSATVVMDTISRVFQLVHSNELIVCAAETLSPSLATAWESVFHCDSITLTKSRQKQQNDIIDVVTSTLKTIMSAFQTRYSGPYDTPLLDTLSPLLLSALSSHNPPIVDIILTFWKLTFDQTQCSLVYPHKLREALVDHGDRLLNMGSMPASSPLRPRISPGRRGNIQPAHFNNKSPSRHGNVPPTRGDVSPAGIVHPVTSPRKNVRGSFMHQPTTSSPHRPHPLSPAAKALDEVLARSSGSGKSHDQVGGVPLETSARRKLTLNEEKYVHVAPSPKKPRLLTEHQKEKRRERPQIPILYNALDPSQDASLPLSETQTMDCDDDDVIITHEAPPSADSAPTTSSAGATPLTPPTQSSAPSDPGESPTTDTLAPITDPPPTKTTDSPISGDGLNAAKYTVAVTSADSANPVTSVIVTMPTSSLPTGITIPSLSAPSPFVVQATSTADSALSSAAVTVTADSAKPTPNDDSTMECVTASDSVALTHSVANADSATASAVSDNADSATISEPLSMSNTADSAIFLTAASPTPADLEEPTTVAVVENSIVKATPTTPLDPPTAPSTQTAIATTHADSANLPPPSTSESVINAVTATVAMTTLASSSTSVTASDNVATNSISMATTSVTMPTTAIGTQSGKRLSLKKHNGESLKERTVRLEKHSLMAAREDSLPSIGSKNSPIPTFGSKVNCSTATCRSKVIATVTMPGAKVSYLRVSESSPLYLSGVGVTTPSSLGTSGSKVNTSTASGSTVNTPTLAGSKVKSPTLSKLLSGSVTPTSATPTNTIPIGSLSPPMQLLTTALLFQLANKMSPRTTFTKPLILGKSQPDRPPGKASASPQLPTPGGDGSKGLVNSGGSVVSKTVTMAGALNRKTHGTWSSGAAMNKAPPTRMETTTIGATVARDPGGARVKKEEGVVWAPPTKPTNGACRQSTPRQVDSPPSQLSAEAINKLVSPVIFALPQFRVTITGITTGQVAMTTAQSSLTSVVTEATPTLSAVSAGVASSTAVTSSGGAGMEVDKNDTTTTVEDTQIEVVDDEKTNCVIDDDQTAQEAENDDRMKTDETEVAETSSKHQQKEAANGNKKSQEEMCTGGHAPTEPASPQSMLIDVGGDLEDPLLGVRSHDKHVTGQEDPKLLATPTHRRPLEDGVPTGILKHVSQFDTPSSATKSERRVQFAQEHTVHLPESREAAPKTPRHSRASKTPHGIFSSRRTLLKSLTPPKKLIAVPKPPQTPPTGSCDPIYPSLSDCPSPIEQILPSLTASKYTHGLVQLVRARNITTVGNISSLTESEVQGLPIKSPKVVTLRRALRSFEQNLGSKRKSSTSDTDSTLLHPAKVARLTPDPKTTVNESEDIFDDVIPCTPPTQSLDLSTPNSQIVAIGNKEGPHPPNKDSAVTPDLSPAKEGPKSETSTAATSESAVTMETEEPHPPPVLHDHMYCSQDLSPQRDGERDEATTSADSANASCTNSNKLSLGTSDHTYCKVGVASVDESGASQELFSCHTEMDSELVANNNTNTQLDLDEEDEPIDPVGVPWAECGVGVADNATTTGDPPDPRTCLTSLAGPPEGGGVVMSTEELDLLEALLNRGMRLRADGISRERGERLCSKSHKFFHNLFLALYPS